MYLCFLIKQMSMCWISNITVWTLKHCNVSDAVCYRDHSFWSHPRLLAIISSTGINFCIFNTINQSSKFNDFSIRGSDDPQLLLQSIGNCSAQHPGNSDYRVWDSDKLACLACGKIFWFPREHKAYRFCLQILELSSIFQDVYV